MKILHILHALVIGGVTAVVRELTQALVGEGIHCEIAATDGGRATGGEQSIPGVPIHCFPVGFHPRWRIFYSPALSRFLEAEAGRFDLLHIHGIGHQCPAASRAALRQGVPYISSPHGSLAEWALRHRSLWRRRVYMPRVQKPVLQSATAVHCLTDQEVAQITHWTDGRTAVFTVPNGIPADLPDAFASTDPAEFLARFPGLAGRRVILFMGRLAFQKGPEILVRSFATIAPRFPDAVLLMAGYALRGGGTRRRVEAALRQTPDIRQRVIFTGPLSGYDWRAAYACAELFVLPSRWEGFGIVLLEAMAAGLAVVVSDRCDIHPLVADADAGLVTPPEEKPLAEAMAALLSDRQETNRMGENGRRLAARYTWPAVAQSMAARYSEIIRQPRG